MTPRNLLDLSKQIYDQNSSEAAYRTTVSRSYYSAFYVASERCKAESLHGHGNTHEGVIKALQGSKKHQTAGNMMHTLRRCRTDADYKLEKPITASQVRKMLSMTEALHKVLE
jgi:uncharacterized protein (UPF0332 family)